MPATCCVLGCSNRGNKKPGVSLYRFPRDPERQAQWVAAVDRGPRWKPNDHTRLCSEHFISGKKNDNPRLPDYVPSVFIDIFSPKIKQSTEPPDKKDMNQEDSIFGSLMVRDASPTEAVVCVEDQNLVAMTENTGTEQPERSHNGVPQLRRLLPKPLSSNSITTPTTSSTKNVDLFNDQHDAESSMTKETLQDPLKRIAIDKDSFQDDDKKVEHFTGMPTYSVMMATFAFLDPHIPAKVELSNFKQFLLTCMRLKLNFTLQHLAYYFNTSLCDAAKAFHSVINTMYKFLVPALVVWPDREDLRQSLPKTFQPKFDKCVCVLDTVGVLAAKPDVAKTSNRVQDKVPNLLKYLLVFTSSGAISYVSSAVQGNMDDKLLIENSGILEHLQPGDLILACENLDIPDVNKFKVQIDELDCLAFTKYIDNKLSPIEVSTDLHPHLYVQYVFGCVVKKFSMMGGVIHADLAKPTQDGVTILDKIVHICCALHNLSEPYRMPVTYRDF